MPSTVHRITHDSRDSSPHTRRPGQEADASIRMLIGIFRDYTLFAERAKLRFRIVPVHPPDNRDDIEQRSFGDSVTAPAESEVGFELRDLVLQKHDVL